MSSGSASQFDIAIARIKEIVGSEFLVQQGEEVRLRAQDTLPRVRLPSAFVYPNSTEQIQAIAKVSNEFGVPLWPVSRGRNWGYGGASPVKQGAIIVVLERMNRILEINEKLAYAVIEPGVSYGQLNRHLKENGSRLWCDTTDSTPLGSVLGNALERGVGETPYGDHFANLCGLEVVLPTGELIRTGGGPQAGCATWHTHKWGLGPYIEGLFSQGNFGIVTRAGMWLMPAPAVYVSFVFELKPHTSVVLFIDALRDLLLHGVIEAKVHAVNEMVGLLATGHYPREALEGRTFLADEVRRSLCRQNGVAPWSAIGALYGTADEVRVAKRRIKKSLGPLGRLTFLTDREVNLAKRYVERWKQNPDSVTSKVAAGVVRLLTGKPMQALEMVPHVHDVLQGIPGEYFLRYAYVKASSPLPERDVNPARDGCGLIWFAPVIPLAGDALERLLAAVRPLYEQYGLDLTAGLIVLNPRSLIVLLSVLFSKEDSDETARSQALYDALCAKATELGIQPYRSGVGAADHLLDAAPDFKAFIERLKEAIDPQHLLAPGRYGIR